jgi:hypothetical protein
VARNWWTLDGRKEELKQAVTNADPDFVKGPALGVYALASLLGEEDRTLEWIRATVKNDDVTKWLEGQRDYVRRWITLREGKIKAAGK